MGRVPQTEGEIPHNEAIAVAAVDVIAPPLRVIREAEVKP